MALALVKPGLGVTMSRLGSVALLLALGTFGAFAQAQDKDSEDEVYLPGPLSHYVPVSSTTNAADTNPSWTQPAAPVSTTTTAGMVNTFKPAPVIPAPVAKKPDPKKPALPGVGTYGPVGGV